MCQIDPAAVEDGLSRLLAARSGGAAPLPEHPVICEAAYADWEHLSCPARMPALLGCLLDRAVAPQALKLLEFLLFDSPLTVSAAAPFVLPSLIVLVDEIDAGLRPTMTDLLVWVAVMSEPGQQKPWGSQEEREALCRRVFTRYGEALQRLVEQSPPTELHGPDEVRLLLDPGPG
jgi:hypothetical protein